jgi:hypothetical protein
LLWCWCCAQRDALRQLGELLSTVLCLEDGAALSLDTESDAEAKADTKTDVRAWQFVWRVFRAFNLVAQLVVSVTGTAQHHAFHRV